VEAFRLWRNGGYLVIRQARTVKFPFPHFLHMDITGMIKQFHADKADGSPKPIFKGHYIFGDRAWRCQQLLIDAGYDANKLRKMTDSEVIAEFDKLKEKIDGDY